MTRLTTSRILAAAAVILAVLPAAVFLLSAVAAGMPAGSALSALFEQYGAERVNLTAVTAFGMIPLLLVCVLLALRRWRRRTWDGGEAYALGGVLPIFVVTAFVHAEYWPKYLPDRQFLGFPHGIEFTIGPLVFAPIGVLFGLLIAWTLKRKA